MEGGFIGFICRALHGIRSGNILSPYPIGSALDYFDSVVGLATVFVFLELRWEVLDTEQTSKNLMLCLLTYTHVMAYWLNIPHNLKFSPPTMNVLQVWFVVLFSLG